MSKSTTFTRIYIEDVDRFRKICGKKTSAEKLREIINEYYDKKIC